jgi:flagellar assembly protein FliH
MMSSSGSVLRNATVAEQVTKLARPAGARAAGAVVQAPAPVLEPTPGADIIQGQLDEAYQRGYEQGLDEGRRQAVEAVLATQMEEARRQGLEQGMEAGLRAAQETAAASVNQALATLERLLGGLPQQLHARMGALEEDMVALSFEALTRVLGQTAASPDGLRALLRQALSQFGPRQLLEVRVHPADLQCLANDEVTGAWLRQREGGGRAQIVADAGVELGGMVLRSPAGRLDARLETQLAALRHALTAARAERSSARASAAQDERTARTAAPAQGGQP